MSKKSGYGKIMLVVMLAVFIFIAGGFGTMILSQQQQTSNVTGTVFANDYNSSIAMQQSFVSLMPYLGFFLFVIALILIVKSVRGKH